MVLTVALLHRLADLPHANTMQQWARIRDRDFHNPLHRSHKGRHHLSHSAFKILTTPVLALQLCYLLRKTG